MLELNTKVNTNYIASLCWQLTFYLFLKKVLTIVLIVFLIETWTQPVLPSIAVYICHMTWQTNADMLLRRIDKPLIDFIRDDDDVMFTTQFCYHFQLFQRHHLRHVTN